MFDKHFNLKLIDFGMATYINSNDNLHLAGTLKYTSTECLLLMKH
jgi:hypothetical protein